MPFKDEFLHNLLGDISLAYYAAACVFCLMGIAVSLYLHSLGRCVDSTHTPEKYSVRFLIWDNSKRIAASLIVMLVIFRFTQNILAQNLSMWLAFLIGLALVSVGVDKIVQLLQTKFGLFTKERTPDVVAKFEDKP